jgi:tetratricopeptide (TPR) repeat protein
LLEDIHWADELSLALVAYLARNLTDVPLLLVLVHRPMPPLEMELLAEVKNQPYAHTIHLEPLTVEESQELSRMFLGDKQVPPDVAEILLSRGQGNPFFLQEIAGAILDVAAKHIDQATKRLDNLNLPDTVQDVILTRVDRLSEEEKLTLKVASVIGPSFQRSLLLAAHPLHQTRFLLSSQLEDLEKEKLIRLESPAPKWEYIFHNVVTQEVVYEGLLLAQRRQLHRQVGLALENLVPDEVEQLAFHYSRSDDETKAIQYLKIAGDKARREYANQVAINYYSEILDRLANQSAPGHNHSMVTSEYWDILLERANLNNLIGRRDEAIEDLGALGLIAEALQDDYRRVLVTKQWANLYEVTGDYDSALEVIERCVVLGQKVGQEQLVGEGYNQWGKLLFLHGEYETADEYLQRALVIAQNYQDKATQADCLNSLGLVGHYQNDFDVALYFFEEALGLWREIGDRIGLGTSLSHLGRVNYDMGQYTQAQQCYEQALMLHRTIGDRAGEGMTKRNLGRLMCTLGNYPSACDLLEEALVINHEVGDRRGVAYSLYQLAFLYTRLAEYDKAVGLFTEALEILQDLNDTRALGDALTLYGWTLYEQGQPRQAKKLLEEALKTQRDTQQEVKMIECVAHLGRVALAAGDLSLADTCARRALDFITHQGTAGVEHPPLVYLTCYHTLQANHKLAQAQRVVELAQAYLTAQLAFIKDSTLQQSYLNNVPENRIIRELELLE